MASYAACIWSRRAHAEGRDRPYQGGRSKHWVKNKNHKHPAMDRVMEYLAVKPVVAGPYYLSGG